MSLGFWNTSFDFIKKKKNQIETQNSLSQLNWNDGHTFKNNNNNNKITIQLYLFEKKFKQCA